MFLDDMDHSEIFYDMMKNNCLFYTGSSLCLFHWYCPPLLHRSVTALTFLHTTYTRCHPLAKPNPVSRAAPVAPHPPANAKTASPAKPPAPTAPPLSSPPPTPTGPPNGSVTCNARPFHAIVPGGVPWRPTLFTKRRPPLRQVPMSGSCTRFANGGQAQTKKRRFLHGSCIGRRRVVHCQTGTTCVGRSGRTGNTPIWGLLSAPRPLPITYSRWTWSHRVPTLLVHAVRNTPNNGAVICIMCHW